MVRLSGKSQTPSQNMTTVEADLFSVLGVERSATEVEVRRAFKSLITKEHPDKGGDPDKFKLIKLAYDTLSDRERRNFYTETGKIARSAAEDFMDKFRGGSFGQHHAASVQQKQNLAEAITISLKPEHSHSAGFEAWMRSRGEDGTQVFTAESMADRFGVNRGSYEPVYLPKLLSHKVVCKEVGGLREKAEVISEPIPAELEWGQVLVKWLYAPIDAADNYVALTGGTYGETSCTLPYGAGQHGLASISKVGPGTKGVAEGEWVVPLKPHLGTWQCQAVVKANDLVTIPRDCMAPESAALNQQLCLAYCLLEQFGKVKMKHLPTPTLPLEEDAVGHASLEIFSIHIATSLETCIGVALSSFIITSRPVSSNVPGDCVILNAATSTVGQAVIQLCATLQLRCVAVASDHGSFEKTTLWLQSLGATHVLKDEGLIRVELEKLHFFAKPKLALDAVGDSSALRLADALAEGGQLVVYGCLSGKPPVWPWQSWVFRGLQVQGFNFGSWMLKNSGKIPKMMAALGKLFDGDQLRIAVTEYDLATEFEEALDHALDRGTNSKALLCMGDAEVLESVE